jgi:hypothetical protein
VRGLREGRLAAGEARTFELAYDLPPDARGLSLRISWEGAFLNLVDRAVFGDRRLALE